MSEESERYWRVKVTTTASAVVIVEAEDEEDARIEAQILPETDVDWQVDHEGLDVEAVEGECDWFGTLKTG